MKNKFAELFPGDRTMFKSTMSIRCSIEILEEIVPRFVTEKSRRMQQDSSTSRSHN